MNNISKITLEAQWGALIEDCIQAAQRTAIITASEVELLFNNKTLKVKPNSNATDIMKEYKR